MLKSLLIKNYAIIDHLETEWPEGLIAITGETGAGKSIIIGALQLVLGARADSKTLRNSEEKCIIEAKFIVGESIQKMLQEQFEIEDPDEIILRREIMPNGKSRLFINDSPALAQTIQNIASYLVSIYQQFDQLEILDGRLQMDLLDNFCDINSHISDYQKNFNNFEKLTSKLKQLHESNRKAGQEKDFIDFQLQELDQINLKENELKSLEEKFKIFNTAEEIILNTSASFNLLSQDQGILDQLQEIMGLLKQLQFHSGIHQLYERISQSQTELKEISHELEHISENTETQAEQKELLQQRIDVIYRLIQKHRVADDLALIQLRDELENKMEGFQNTDDEIKKLDLEISTSKKDLVQKATFIRSIRMKKAPELSEKTEQLLHVLGMEYAKFSIQFEECPLYQKGMDQISFIFSANKGSALKALKSHASGGELSRLNLALNSLVITPNNNHTLIYDEIDTGVSGQVALQMGNLLKTLSKTNQLITITHSPQVASRADHHYFVYKDSTQKQTLTQIRKLDQTDKIIEIAKMLSGDPPSGSALKAAKELRLL
ncbi:MAG: DNA repair protein RecN [Bacteroidota bacterium]|nr:DNA repair protein RecN [Bacteroidota bacterium]